MIPIQVSLPYVICKCCLGILFSLCMKYNCTGTYTCVEHIDSLRLYDLWKSCLSHLADFCSLLTFCLSMEKAKKKGPNHLPCLPLRRNHFSEGTMMRSVVQHDASCEDKMFSRLPGRLWIALWKTFQISLHYWEFVKLFNENSKYSTQTATRTLKEGAQRQLKQNTVESTRLDQREH